MSLPSLPEGALAVIFANTLSGEAEGYGDTADRMVTLAEGIPGYLGHISTRGADGFGITVSFWADEAAISAWRAHPEHRAAIATGRGRFYAQYDLVTAAVRRHVPFVSTKEDAP